MKVALLTREYPPDVYGGAGVHAEYMARELARRIDVTVHCWGAERPAAAVPAVAAYRPWEALDGERPYAAALQAFSIDLAMAAGAEGSDLVHSHTWYANLGGHLAKLVHGVPHVTTVHSLEPMRPWKREQLGGGYALSSFAERTALEAADAVVAVSKEHLREILSCYPAIDESRTSVIYNGIDTEEYRPDLGTDVLERHGIDPARPAVVFVGRITRRRASPICSTPPSRSIRTRNSCSAPVRPTRPRSRSRSRRRWSGCAPSAATRSGSSRCCPSPR